MARRLGLEVNMHQAHCFMHQDKRPSLAFKNNLWKCFACDKGGDAISLVEEKCNLSFVEACTWLCEQYHIYMPSTNLKNTKKRPKLRHRRTLVIDREGSRPDFDGDVASAIINLADLEAKGKEFLFYGKETVGSSGGKDENQIGRRFDKNERDSNEYL